MDRSQRVARSRTADGTSPAKNCSPVSRKVVIAPMDHMSIAPLYPAVASAGLLFWYTSLAYSISMRKRLRVASYTHGAMYGNVPASVNMRAAFLFASELLAVIRLASPKSVRTTRQPALRDVMSTFSGLMSLCAMPRSWRYSTARMTCCMMTADSASLSRVSSLEAT